MKGSLQIKSGMYYVVVDYKNEYDKRKQKWISTDITSKNNKTKALAKKAKILMMKSKNYKFCCNKNLKKRKGKMITKCKFSLSFL